jgi:hypothetical protein
MKKVNSSPRPCLVARPILVLGCGGDNPPSNNPAPPPTSGSTGGRGGSGGTGGTGGGSAGTGGGAAGSGGGAGAKMDAPVRAPDAASPADAPPFAPTPSNIPILVFDLPGIPIETVGDQKVAGNVSIIENQTTPRDGQQGRAGGLPHGGHARLYRHRAARRRRQAAHRRRAGVAYQGDWILQACGVADKPCLRNMLGFAIGAQMVTGAPKARFVEVYYNEEYKGLFQLIAPPTKEQGRVDITAPAADGTGEAISGGYVIRRFGLGASLPTAMPVQDFLSSTEEGGMFPHRLLYTYLFPKPGSLTPAQRTYIEGHIAQFEAAMKARRSSTEHRLPQLDRRAQLQRLLHLRRGQPQHRRLLEEHRAHQAEGRGHHRGKLSITPFWDFSIAFGLPELRTGWRSDRLSFDAVNSASTAPPPLAASAWPWTGRWSGGRRCAGPTAACRPPSAGCREVLEHALPAVLVDQHPVRRHLPERDPLPLPRAAQDRRRAGHGPAGRADHGVEDPAGRRRLRRHVQRTPNLREFVFPFNPYRMDPRTAPDPMATPAAFFDKEVTWFRNWVDARLKWLDDNLPGVCGAINEVPRDGGAPPSDGGRPPPDTVELARGLIGYWSFDEGTGVVAKDASPLMNNGQLMRFSTADWVPAHLGTGLNYTPTLSPVVLVPDSPSLNPTTGLSIGAWIRASDWAGNRRIAQKGENDDQYRLTAENGVLKFHLSGVTNGSLEAVLPATGALHHVMGTFEGNQIRIYIDGVVAAQEDAAVGTNRRHTGQPAPRHQARRRAAGGLVLRRARRGGDVQPRAERDRGASAGRTRRPTHHRS